MGNEKPSPSRFYPSFRKLTYRYHLQQPISKSLNRLRVQVGRCGSNMATFREQSKSQCICGKVEETMEHPIACVMYLNYSAENLNKTSDNAVFVATLGHVLGQNTFGSLTRQKKKRRKQVFSDVQLFIPRSIAVAAMLNSFFYVHLIFLIFNCFFSCSNCNIAALKSIGNGYLLGEHATSSISSSWHLVR